MTSSTFRDSDHQLPPESELARFLSKIEVSLGKYIANLELQKQYTVGWSRISFLVVYEEFSARV